MRLNYTVSQIQEDIPELAREFVEATEYRFGPAWEEMPILKTLASGLSSGAFYDMDIDRVDDAHSILLRLKEAGFCVVRLSQLSELEDRAGSL